MRRASLDVNASIVWRAEADTGVYAVSHALTGGGAAATRTQIARWCGFTAVGARSILFAYLPCPFTTL